MRQMKRDVGHSSGQQGRGGNSHFASSCDFSHMKKDISIKKKDENRYNASDEKIGRMDISR